MALALINDRTHHVVAAAVELALTRHARRRGLLGRGRLDADAAMLIAPCIAVHTAFLRFPIDVVFVDRAGRAVQIAHELRPWRIAASVRAHAVIELAAGRLRASGVEIGDRLYLAPESQAC